MSLTTQSCFGLSGTNAKYADEHTGITLCGNALKLYDLRGGNSKFLYGEGSSISCFSVNKENKVIAYAEQGSEPSIHIHSLSSGFEKVCTITEIAELDIICMAFSRDGGRLAIVCGDPENKIVIWDWRRNEKIIETAKKGSTGNITSASFCPTNSDVLAVSGLGFLNIYTIEQIYQTYFIKEKTMQAAHYEPCCHAWHTDRNLIYCGCCEGELLLFDTKMGIAVPPPHSIDSDDLTWVALPMNTPMTCIAVNKLHCVIGGESSMLQWYFNASVTDGQEMQQVYELDLGIEGIGSLEYSLDWEHLLICSLESSIHQVTVMKGQEPCHDEVGSFHHGLVTGIVGLPNGRLVASSGIDGTVRVWDLEEETCFTKRQFTSPQTCLSVSDSGLMVTGTETGVIRLIALDTEDLKNLMVVSRFRLHSSSVTAVTFSPSGKFLASVGQDGKCFFTSVDPMTGQASPIGWVPVSDPVLALSWAPTYDGQDGALILSVASGEVVHIEAPLGNITAGAEMKLSVKDVPTRKLRVEFPLMSLDTFVPDSSDAGSMPGVVSTSFDRKLKRYPLPEENQAWGGLKARFRKPTAEAEIHDKSRSLCVLSSDKLLVATTGDDARINLCDCSDPDSWGPIMNVDHGLVHGNTSDEYSGCSSISFNSGNSHIIVGGNNGCIYVFALPGYDVPMSANECLCVDTTHEVDVDDIDDANETTVAELKENNDKEIAEAASEKKKNDLKSSLIKLQNKVKEIVTSNDDLPDMEQLERKDFIIDLDLKGDLQDEGLNRVNEVKKEILKSNIVKDLKVNRLKSEFMDSMSTKGKVVIAFNLGNAVFNYPIPMVTKLDASQRKVHFLRAVEKKEEMFSGRKVGDNTIPKTTGAPVDVLPSKTNEEVSAEATTPTKTTPSKSLKANEAQLEEEEEDLDISMNSLPEKFLYSDFSVYSMLRKTTQLFLLTALCRQHKKSFNDRFNKIVDRKGSDIDKVTGLNERVSTILNELQITEEVVSPKLSPMEIEDSVLIVSDEEVSVEKFVSEAEKARIAQANKEDDERRKDQTGDNPEERALKTMMGGTLASKGDQDGMGSLEKPEFMDTLPESDWNEEQTTAAKEFTIKQQALEEDKEKKRVALETEIKKLKSDITEICITFDHVLDDLFWDKLKVESKIGQLDTQMVHLSESYETSTEQDAMRENVLLGDLENLKTSKGSSTTALTDFKREVDSHKEKVDHIALEDKNLDRSFKKEFSELDEEYMEYLLKLFKRRAKVNRQSESEIPVIRRRASNIGKLPQGAKLAPVMGALGFKNALNRSYRRSSLTNPHQTRLSNQGRKSIISLTNNISQPSSHRPSEERGNTIGGKPTPVVNYLDPYPGDPTCSNRKTYNPTDFTNVVPLDSVLDRPEDLDLYWWDKIVEMRDAKIKSEGLLKSHQSQLSDMLELLSYLSSDDEKNRDAIEDVLREVGRFKDSKLKNIYNLYIPLNLKQAQVEIEDSGIKEQAVLVNRSVVENKNSDVIGHGGSKSDILVAIKDFKKGIYDLQWENKKCDMVMDDWVEKTKEFQLLRVTKSLQDFIKNGEDTGNSQETVSLENRLEHNRKLHEKNLRERSVNLRKVDKQIEEKKLQNSDMGAQLEGMLSLVEEQQRIYQAQLESGGVEEVTKRRMKSMVTQRKLRDISKSQKEEVDVLGEELERLRLRTYPSFLEKQVLPVDEQFIK